MNFLQRVKSASTMMFGYDAVASTKRRNAPRQSVKSEDYELQAIKRKKLNATTLDQQRNFAIVGWMVRKHLDYVSRFMFHAQTGIDEIDELLEKRWNDWAGRRRCDVGRRHNLDRMMRLFETGKAIEGDSGILKVQGGFLQGIEGSRIAKPSGKIPQKYEGRITEHGLILDSRGAVEKYCVCRRDDQSGQLVMDGEPIDAGDLVFDGYFMRFDQMRGVSPMAAAVNTFQDLYEAFDYQLIKVKMHAMFGVFITSPGDNPSGSGFGEVDSDTGVTGTATTTRYDFDLKPGLKLEGQPGDTISTIESHTPSTEFQAYSEMMIHIALLSLDIPLSFYNSIKANFSGRKMDMVEYEMAAQSKRDANRECLYEIAEWRVPQIVAADVELQQAIAANGLTADTLEWDFQPQSGPWIDEAAEVNAIIAKIGAGLTSITRECKKKGIDARDIAKERGSEIKMYAAENVPLTIGQPGQATTGNAEQPSGNQEDQVEPEPAEIEGEGLNKWLT